MDFGWGSAPDPAGGAYSAPQTPSWIWGPTSKGRGGDGRGGEGRGGKGNMSTPQHKFLVAPLPVNHWPARRRDDVAVAVAPTLTDCLSSFNLIEMFCVLDPRLGDM